MPSYAKTTGSRRAHVYVPIVRGPTQKEVWTFAKALAGTSRPPPGLMTAEYKVAKRPQGRVLSTTTRTPGAARWPRSIRCGPTLAGRVSTPVTWEEIERGVTIEDFRLDNVRARITKTATLFKPLRRKAAAWIFERSGCTESPQPPAQLRDEAPQAAFNSL